MTKKRLLTLLVMAGVVCVLSVYMSSIRANGKATPCEGDGSPGTNWKWGYCHNGHGICTGDATEVKNHTGHTEHGDNNPNNPKDGCVFAGCCSDGDTDESQCKKVYDGK